MLKILKKFCIINIFSYFCIVINTQHIMKKSEILNALIFETASIVTLVVDDDEAMLSLEGTFSPLQAMRLIKKLPAKFRFSYRPIEYL